MVRLEIVTPFIGSMVHCRHCQVFLDEAGIGSQVRAADLQAYPPEWQAEWQRLSALIDRLARRFGSRLTIMLTDAQSLRGLWWALRGVRRYPAFLLAGERFVGWDEAPLLAAIERHLSLAEG